MTENSPLFGSQPGADTLRSASAKPQRRFRLAKGRHGGNLRLAEVSTWRISDEGLYVVDGAMAPNGCTAATNPARTIAALAERCVENILSRDF